MSALCTATLLDSPIHPALALTDYNSGRSQPSPAAGRGAVSISGFMHSPALQLSRRSWEWTFQGVDWRWGHLLQGDSPYTVPHPRHVYCRLYQFFSWSIFLEIKNIQSTCFAQMRSQRRGSIHSTQAQQKLSTFWRVQSQNGAGKRQNGDSSARKTIAGLIESPLLPVRFACRRVVYNHEAYP